MSPRLPDGRHARPAEAAYLGHLLFGILMALLGAILPELAAGLGVDLAQAGRLFLLMNACILLVSFVLGPLLDRFGTQPPLVVGPLLAGLGLVAVALASRSAALAWAALLLGVGGGALNGSANTLIADLHESQAARNAALNRLGVFYGIGALGVPLALGLLLGRVSLGAILLGGALLCLAVAARNARARLPPPKLAEPPPRGVCWRCCADASWRSSRRCSSSRPATSSCWPASPPPTWWASSASACAPQRGRSPATGPR